MKCPWQDCGYIRKTSDTGPAWECPSCKNLYNKHPDYYGNNYFSIQLTYKEIPSDAEIKPEKLYLYLTDGEVEGAVLYKAGVVERTELFESDLGKDTVDIKNVLNNPPSTLTSEQEAAICIATARKKAQQEEIEELKEQEEQKNKKVKLIIVSVVIFIIIIVLYYFLSDDTSVKASTAASSSNTPFQQTIQNKFNSNDDAFLNTNGINLEFIASKLDLADSLVKQCQNICQSNHTMDDSCAKVSETIDGISTQISKYKEYVQGASVDRLSPNNKHLVEQINQQLWSIPQEFESAQSFCEHNAIKAEPKEVISNPAIAPRKNDKIDFQSMDIHLDIIYSKVYAADANVRDCRMRCEAHTEDPRRNFDTTSCSLFLNISKEYEPDMNKLMEVIQQQGRDKISKDDDERILKIFYLWKDVEMERQNLVSCLRAL